MTPFRKETILISAALPATTLLVFVVLRSYLFAGWFADDYSFLLDTYQTTGSRMDAVFRSWGDAFYVFSPWRGWFYRPLQLLHFGAMRAVFGPNPIAFHAANLFLHSFCVWLLGLLVWRVSRNVLAAIGGALIFAFWPVGSEAPWWSSAVSVLQMTAGYLGALHLWLSFRQDGRTRFAAGSLICCGLSLLSKSEAVTIPIALMLLDAGTGQWNARRLWQYLPFCVAVAAFVIVERTAAEYYTRVGDQNARKLYNFTTAYKLDVYYRMLVRLFLPAWNSRDPYSVALLASLVGGTLWAWRKTQDARLSFAAFAWMALSAAPVAAVAGNHALFSRFSYLPTAGAAAALAGCVLLLCRTPAGRLVVAAWVGCLAGQVAPWPGDPLTVWGVGFAMAAILAVAVTCRALPVTLAVRCGALAVAPMFVSLLPAWALLPLALAVIVALPGLRLQWAFIALMVWNWGACPAAFAAVALLALHLGEQAYKSRHTSKDVAADAQGVGLGVVGKGVIAQGFNL